MTSQLCVGNSSPLIVFQRIGQLSLLQNLLEQLYIPPAVRFEVFGSTPLPVWIKEQSLAQPLASQILAARIGAGEREAIALALELQANLLVIDDLAARRLAQSLKITIIGSLGLLVRAKERGLISSVRPLMEAMQSEEFRISDSVFAGILAAAGER
jgi:predicted nucleic acid-binding protein